MEKLRKLIAFIIFTFLLSLSPFQIVNAELPEYLCPYENEYYKILVPTNNLQVQGPYFYRMRKRLQISVFKVMKEPYKALLRNWIQNEGRSIFFNPADQISYLDQQEQPYIVEFVDLDFDDRMADITEDWISGDDGKAFLNDDYDCKFPLTENIYYIEDNEEYGAIANTLLNLYAANEKEWNHLDSDQPQVPYGTTTSSSYLDSLPGDYKPLPYDESVYGKEKETMVFHTFVNKASFHKTSELAYEGWIKMVVPADKEFVFDDARSKYGPVKESYIYTKINLANNHVQLKAEKTTYRNTDETTYSELDTPEELTYDSYLLYCLVNFAKGLAKASVA